MALCFRLLVFFSFGMGPQMGVQKWLNTHHCFGVERSQSLNFLWIFLMCLIMFDSKCQKRLLYMRGRRNLIHSLHQNAIHFCLCFLFPVVSLLWQHSLVKCAMLTEVFPCSCCARRFKRLRWKVLRAQPCFLSEI